MRYTIYIKSHGDYPDYDDEVEADSREEAGKKFCDKLNRASAMYDVGDVWSPSDIEKYIASEDDINKN